ncbi:unnamed protein product [Trichogramma brassicae]|uniref:Uncharacterized protein n=1 Tax=Trichogramma brassicae TaxID=86971 RepID=A0A6H5IS14_9HYME|nr:unnamed protein product [Trichogramma brassicae]
MLYVYALGVKVVTHAAEAYVVNFKSDSYTDPNFEFRACRMAEKPQRERLLVRLRAMSIKRAQKVTVLYTRSSSSNSTNTAVHITRHRAAAARITPHMTSEQHYPLAVLVAAAAAAAAPPI